MPAQRGRLLHVMHVLYEFIIWKMMRNHIYLYIYARLGRKNRM